MRLALLLALSAAWPVQTLPSGDGSAIALGADGGPRGIAVVLERRPAGRRTRILEERLGSRVRRIATSRNGFGPLELDHDRRGSRTHAWSAIPPGGGPRSVFVGEPGQGVRRLIATGANTLLTALDVAPSGAAVLAAWSRDGVFVTSRPPGGRFGPPVRIAGAGAGFPAAAIADDGTATVAYQPVNEGLELELRRIAPDGTVGAPARVASALPAAGATAATRPPALAVTARGLAVAALTVTERVAPGRERDPVRGSRVDTVGWAASADAPDPVRALSAANGAAGVPALRPVGDRVVIVWPQARTAEESPRTLRAVRWFARGPSAPETYRSPRSIDPGASLALGGARAGAIAAYFTSSRRLYAVRLTRRGPFTGAERLSPDGQAVESVLATADGARSVAVWTSGRRVHLARRRR